ncbi:MAG: diguanylate cyclase [Gammaproteobacteria bacterium]|nr:diguanylate cyclase [Gammaproteobacteria bacterium]MDH5734732.1 diguanylate cyclase [Gammaproteobacteria bacterium]
MIKKKYKAVLVSGLMVILSIIVVDVFISLKRINLVDLHLESVVNEHMYHAISAENMIYHARERSLLMLQIIMTEDALGQEGLKRDFSYHGEQFLQMRKNVIDSNPDEGERLIIDQQDKLSEKVLSMQHQVIELAEHGRFVEAKRLLLEKVLPVQNGVISLLRQFIELQNNHTRHALEESGQAYLKTVYTTVFSIVAIVLVGGLLIYYLSRKFSSIDEQMRKRDEELHITNRILNDNIGELNAVTEQLQKSEQQERAIRENMLDAVIMINARGVMESCNPAAEKIFGYTKEEMLGQNVAMLMPTSFRNKHDMYLKKYRDTGESMNMNMARDQNGMRKDGSVFPLDIGISQMMLDNEVKVVGIMRDITERVEAEKVLRRSKEELEQLVHLRTVELEEANQQLLHLARHDSLTGLANRALLEENLKVAIAYARRNEKMVALMFIDLDGFKQVNDTLGHDVGDQLLIKVAYKLKSFVRAEDCVSRMGGDEFVIMLFGLENEHDVSVTAQRILDDFIQPIDISGHDINVGASIGISLFPENADDCVSMIKCADEAMYQVKKSGKNNYGFCDRKI